MNMIDPSYMPEPMQQAAEPAGPDLMRLLRRLIRGLPILVVTGILGIFGGYVLLKKLPAKYTSSVLLLIDPKQPGQLGADDFTSTSVDNSKVASIELVLQSSSLLREVVRKLHLADDPAYGALPPSRLAWLTQFLPGNKPPHVDDTPEDREDRAVGVLEDIVRPGRVGATYVIRLDVVARKATDAAEIAGAVAGTYIDDLTNSRQVAARRDAKWLSDQIKQQRAELLNSEVAVAAIQQKYGLIGDAGKDEMDVDRQSVKGVNGELIAAEGDVAGLQSRADEAAAALRDGNVLQLPDVANSPVIQALLARQTEAQQRLATLSTRYASDYPAVKQVSHELASINGALATQAKRIVEGIQTQYRMALAHKSALNTEVSKLVGKVNATAEAQGRVELQEAERIADANRAAYEASLTRLRDVQQQASRLDVEARIISGPDLPDRPSFPRVKIMLPAGGAAGFLLGLVIVFLLPINKEKIETASEVERDLSLNVLGSIPFLSANRLTHAGQLLTITQYMALRPFSVFAESLRVLRYRMQASLPSGGRVIQVTSSVPGEGKSTLAASLAVSAATAHARTVLIDLDLHRRGASRLLASDSNSGVADFLIGKVTIDMPGRPHETLPITVFDAGSYEAVRPGLIESHKLSELISKLRQEYDFVVVDTPPVLAVSDGLFITRLVDATVLVVAWRDTPRSVVLKAAELLRSSGAKLTGVVLNKVIEGNALVYDLKNYGYCSDVLAKGGTAIAKIESSRDMRI